jgi:hypothetical protein
MALALIGRLDLAEHFEPILICKPAIGLRLARGLGTFGRAGI